MVTKLAQVTVTRIEAGAGFLVACTCGHRLLRAHRYEADAHAVDHQRSHTTTDPADQVWEF